MTTYSDKYRVAVIRPSHCLKKRERETIKGVWDIFKKSVVCCFVYSQWQVKLLREGMHRSWTPPFTLAFTLRACCKHGSVNYSYHHH